MFTELGLSLEVFTFISIMLLLFFLRESCWNFLWGLAWWLLWAPIATHLSHLPAGVLGAAP